MPTRLQRIASAVAMLAMAVACLAYTYGVLMRYSV